MADRPVRNRRAAVWGVLDQFVSALSNAAMTFIAARSLGTTDFGVYALLFTAISICIGAARALTSEAYTVLMSTGAPDERRRRQSQCLGASLVLGVGVAVVGGAVGAIIDSAAVAAFGISALFVLGQDTVRFLLVAEQRVKAALVNDLVWVVVLFALLAVVIRTDRASIGLLAACWAVGAAVSLVAGCFQLRVRPRVRSVRTWFRDTRQYSGYYLLEFLALAGSGYSIVYVVALVAGLGAAGAYRGAQAIFGPVTTLTGGLRMVALPSIVRMRTDGRSKVVRAALLFAGALLVITTAIAFGIWLASDWVAPLLLGATAAAAVPLIIPMGLGRAFSSASGGPVLGLRALGATKRSLSARAAVSLLTVVVAGIGGALGGAVGAAWGFAAASALSCVLWTIMLHRQPLVLDVKQREA